MGHDGPWWAMGHVQQCSTAMQLCYQRVIFSPTEDAVPRSRHMFLDRHHGSLPLGRRRGGHRQRRAAGGALLFRAALAQLIRSEMGCWGWWFHFKTAGKNGFHQQNWWNLLDLTNRHVDPKEMTKQVGFKRQYVGINADLSWFKHANCCIIGTKCDRVGGLQCFFFLMWYCKPNDKQPPNLTENAWCTQSPTAP